MEKHKITPEQSFMIGDKIIDAEAGLNAGVQGALVRKKHGDHFPFFKNLMDFARSLKK